MSEENNEVKKFDASKPSSSYDDKSIEKCANLISASLYKMQLGINSIKDELRHGNEINVAILEELQKGNKNKEEKKNE